MTMEYRNEVNQSSSLNSSPVAARCADRRRASGFAYTISAFFLWGLFPIYWKMLKDVPPFEVLSHRIVWCLAFVVALLAATKRLDPRKLISGRRDVFLLLSTGTLIGFSWFLYIVAVESDRILEASMGYYINPLLSIVLGMAVLRERLSRVQLAAFGLAVAGVLSATAHYGKPPWIAISLASIFAVYGLLKKISNHDPLHALGAETLLLAPMALGFILFKGISGTGAFISGGTTETLLLVLSGLVSGLPLYWFAAGAMRIDLSSVGFVQYITPSMMLLIGVFVYKEPFTAGNMLSFGLIWTALALYSFSLLKDRNKNGKRTGAAPKAGGAS